MQLHIKRKAEGLKNSLLVPSQHAVTVLKQYHKTSDSCLSALKPGYGEKETTQKCIGGPCKPSASEHYVHPCCSALGYNSTPHTSSGLKYLNLFSKHSAHDFTPQVSLLLSERKSLPKSQNPIKQLILGSVWLLLCKLTVKLKRLSSIRFIPLGFLVKHPPPRIWVN